MVSLFIASLGLMGSGFGRMGSLKQKAVVGTPAGDGTMDFSIATGDDTGLLALIEDI